MREEYINLNKLRQDFFAKIDAQGHWPKNAKKEVLLIFNKVLAYSDRIFPTKWTVNRKKYFIRNH